MTLKRPLEPVEGFEISRRARLFGLVVAAICAAQFPSSLWGQNTYPWPATGNIGIGTTSPVRSLQVGSVPPGGGVAVTGSAPEFELSNADTEPNSNSISAVWGLATAAGNYGLSPGDTLLGTIGASRGNIYINANYYGGGTNRNVLIQPSSGYVGIGTTTPQHLLHVAGTIGAEEVIVSATGADYVFQPDYHLSPLTEVATYIEQNHHLPGIPSAKEVQEQGVNLGDMQTKLLAKIEELTLHMIETERENQELRNQSQELQERISHLEERQEQRTEHAASDPDSGPKDRR